MEEKRNFVKGPNYFSQNNKYNNPINYNNINEIKKNSKRNQSNIKYRAFNKNKNEEAKNKDFPKNNNKIPKMNFYNINHRKNSKSVNYNEFLQNKEIIEGYTLNKLKNEGIMPVTFAPNKNGFLPYSINSNNNKIQNNNINFNLKGEIYIFVKIMKISLAFI